MKQKFTYLFVLLLLAALPGKGQFNPADPALGFNIFIKNNATVIEGHSDGSAAIGGDLVLTGSYSFAMNNSGSYPNAFNNSNNLGLVIGGKIQYNNGQSSYVNKGLVRIGNSAGSRFFYTDCNNTNTNFRATTHNSNCNTAFNAMPNLMMQAPMPSNSAGNAHGINFTSAFNTLVTNSAMMATYNGTSTALSSLNLATVGSGSVVVNMVANKTNVLNLTSTQLNNITQITTSTQPSATSPLVINVNVTGNFTWNIPISAGMSGTAAKYMIYNFHNNTGTITMAGGATLFGTVLAPNATLFKSNTANIEGQLIAKAATFTVGEIHEQRFAARLPNSSSGGTLPVQDILVGARISGNTVEVSWQTLNEINTDYFEVERSYNNVTFETVQRVYSLVQNGNNGSYRITDNAVQMNAANAVYRIKAMDKDDKYSYSRIASLRLAKINNVVYGPNPFTDYVTINYAATATGKLSINLFNIQGKRVMTKELQVTRGTSTITINNLGNLVKGTYVVEMEEAATSERIHFKIIK